MGYKGQTFSVPLGVDGLSTDDNQARIPITNLIRAQNVTLDKGVIEKESGSRRWNVAALNSGIAGAFDWFPSTIAQRLIVVTRDGVVRRYSDAETVSTVTASGSAPATLAAINPQIVMVEGGSESAGRNKKLFIFTGSNPIQVISGDATTRSNIATPTADWAVAPNYPTFGILHRGRLCAFGNRNDPHRLYMSDPANHETFSGGSAVQFSVFPGEADGLISAVVFKGRLFLFKSPRGAYYLDDADPNPSNWAVRKLSDSFGVASAHSPLNVLNDLYVANYTGSITSLQAVQELGDVASGDILRLLRNEGFMRETTSQEGTMDRQAIYYENKKRAYFTYRSSGGIMNDRLLTFDFNAERPRVTWNDKDRPNCLFLRRDSLGIEKPFYGAEDGYIYEMDREDREVAGAAYEGEFQTPHMDFGGQDPGISERVKLFDFLELTFEETGAWNLSVDIYIDRVFTETLNFKLTKGSTLNNLTLNHDTVVGRMPQSTRLPLHGAGRRISFRCYNSGLRQNFKISGMTVYFRMTGNAQKA